MQAVPSPRTSCRLGTKWVGPFPPSQGCCGAVLPTVRLSLSYIPHSFRDGELQHYGGLNKGLKGMLRAASLWAQPLPMTALIFDIGI